MLYSQKSVFNINQYKSSTLTLTFFEKLFNSSFILFNTFLVIIKSYEPFIIFDFSSIASKILLKISRHLNTIEACLSSKKL